MVRVTEQFDLNNVVSETSLFRAWEQVAAKNACPGIDGVSVETFSRNASSKINRIHNEIIDNSFKPKPLVIFKHEKKNHKFRELAIPTVRDKIAAKTVSNYIVSNFDHKLLPQSYAYRYNKGAIKAAGIVETQCRKKEISHIVRIDIANFFDSINHNLLIQSLTNVGINKRIIDLLMIFVENSRFNGVELVRPHKGIPQGSPLAPVLSNIFLNQLDSAVIREGIKFLRYADDIVFFAQSSSEAMNIMSFITAELQNIDLIPSINKSRIYLIEEGFIFLGFLYTPNGKEPCREATQRLSQKIHENKYDDESENDYHKRIKSVIRGWNNYFHNNTGNKQKHESDKPESNNSSEMKNENYHSQSVDQVTSSNNDKPVYPDEKKELHNAQANTNTATITEKINLIDDLIAGSRNAEAVGKLRNLLNSEEFELSDNDRHSLLSKLAILYRKQGLYGAAEKCDGKKCKEKTIKSQYNKEPAFGKDDIDTWLDLFGSSKDVVYRQYVDRLGRHGYRPASRPLTADYLKNHWIGNHTLAVSVYDKNNFVKFGAIDLDISRKELDTLTLDEFEELRKRLLDDARNILDLAHKAGIEGVLEDSGYKGYHIWFFFFEKLSASLVKEFLQELISQAGEPVKGTHRELFPAGNIRSPQNLNCRIKLPLGIHRLSNSRSKFLAPDGSLCSGEIQILKNRVYLSTAGRLKKAISKWTVYKNIKSYKQTEISKSNKIETLYRSCSVIGALKLKAEKEHYLTHYERIVIRGILNPIGNDGREEIHCILKNCANYGKHITDKMIGTEMYKPIGCNKIKEILSSLCSGLDCNCKFRHKKNDYPHPLRHLSSCQATNHNHQASTTLKSNKSFSNNSQQQPTGKNYQQLSDSESPLNILKQYHTLRKQLIEKQKQIIALLDGAKTLEMDAGTLKSNGQDTQLKNWIIEI